MAKIIALDIGLKRIGVAFSDGKLAIPLSPVLRKNRNQAARDVTAILSEWGADMLVVGVPLGGSSEDEMRRRVEHFVGLLGFSGGVAYVDEALSSMEASELYASSAKDGKLDSIAAMIILNRYIDGLNLKGKK